MWDKFRIAFFHTVSWIARAIVLLLVTIMPWWYGAAQWQAQWWVVAGGLVLAVTTWLATLLSPRRTGGYVQLSLVMVAFMVWAAVALLPLPQALANRLSGSQRFVKSLTIAVDENSEQRWLRPEAYNTASVSPSQTRASIAVLAVAVVVVWSASTLFMSKPLAMLLAITIVVGGVANAGLGLAQLVRHSHVTLLPMPKDGHHFATFVSRNSAPTYYASAIAACLVILGLTFRASKRQRRQDYRVTYPGDSLVGRLRNRFEEVFIDVNSVAVTCVLVIAFLLVVTLATASRGGILGCLAACVVTLCLTLGGRGANYPVAMALALTVLLFIGGVLTLFQLNEPIYSRLEQIDSSLQDGNDTRWVVWGYTLQAWPTYWFTGCGLGTFRFALQPFHTAGPNVWFHHAESVPLEVLLETGLPGMAIAAYAFFLVVRTLYKHSQLQKEYVLLAAVIYATCAIGVQALVDFGLFLPGIFLPYCALLGAFLGRARRIEHEDLRQEDLGAAAHDARLATQQPPRRPTPGKIIGHSVIGVASVVAMFTGLPILSGYSVAEKLTAELKKVDATTQVEGSQPGTIEFGAPSKKDIEALQLSAEAAAQSHSTNPEVALAIGRVELLLWRLDAMQHIDWGQMSDSERWSFSSPQVISSILRLKEPRAQELQARIRSRRFGLDIARDSFERMQWALSACPQDARPAWGVLAADCDWLSPAERDALLELLSRLTGNNSQVMVETAITAIREGNLNPGSAMLKRVWEIDWSKMNVGNLNAVARSLSAEQLLEILPSDPIKRAMAGQMLAKLVAEERDPIAGGEGLVDAIATHVYGQMEKAEPTGASDWRALIWVAQRKQDFAKQAALLQRLALLAPSDFSVKFELAEALRQSGDHVGAIGVLSSLAKGDAPPAIKSYCEQQINIIKESMANPH